MSTTTTCEVVPEPEAQHFADAVANPPLPPDLETEKGPVPP